MKLPDRIYRLAEAANWQSIERYGLLSAGRLMEVAGLTRLGRDRLVMTQRLAHTELRNECRFAINARCRQPHWRNASAT